jgi:uncharacterized protein YnzC (UPF0291/DUF896 family)
MDFDMKEYARLKGLERKMHESSLTQDEKLEFEALRRHLYK